MAVWCICILFTEYDIDYYIENYKHAAFKNKQYGFLIGAYIVFLYLLTLPIGIFLHTYNLSIVLSFYKCYIFSVKKYSITLLRIEKKGIQCGKVNCCFNSFVQMQKFHWNFAYSFALKMQHNLKQNVNCLLFCCPSFDEHLCGTREQRSTNNNKNEGKETKNTS